MSVVAVALLLFGLFGHEVFWVGLVNRLHGTGLLRKFLEPFCNLLNLAQLSFVALLAIWLIRGRLEVPWPLAASGPVSLLHVYLAFCLGVGGWHLAAWSARRLSGAGQDLMVAHQQHIVDVAAMLGYRPVHGRRARALAYVPGNQLFQMHIEEKVLALPGLPAALDNLVVVHLTDIHISGRIDPAYYRHVIKLTNSLDADFVCVTGDICDFADGIGWIDEIFRPLTARSGKFCILGNHDLLTRAIPRVRAVLTAAGVTDVGMAPLVVTVNGLRIAVAGNERPWIDSPGLASAALVPADFKILLSHSPDQLPWARAHGFQLMLSGHTHGGQIRFPLIGPVACPSRFGVSYAAGTYYEPPTALHVGRGVASLLPLRLNCPPEISRLVLRTQDPTITRSAR